MVEFDENIISKFNEKYQQNRSKSKLIEISIKLQEMIKQ